ncbi:MAG: RNA polymerase subunit sigma-70 [Proteobacteria bacterium]|nr:RNA polymerase subunit sigma-70 [Pseudomonadota bacterium]
MTPAHTAAAQAARSGYGKLLAYLAAQTRDLAEAEDALADAFAKALDAWPRTGVPASPEAWLLTAARNRWLDGLRRKRVRSDARDHLTLALDEAQAQAETHHDIPDQRLRLIFACAHPAIAPPARAPMILQTVLGFDAKAIASAFLVAPAAMAQRLVRAKAKIRDAGIPFAIPERADLAERLDAALDAVYTVFTRGWGDPLGADPESRGLAEEAIWLGRLIAQVLPDEPEPKGLLALMLHAHARRAARRDLGGRFVPLDAQDVSLWDRPMLHEAEALIHQAAAAGRPARFQLEAAIQSAHAARAFTGQADWAAVVILYDGLVAMTGSVVAAINRAVALSRSEGPAQGLAALDAVAEDPRLADYQPYWAARADLLARTGDKAAAAAAYDRAIGLEFDPALRDFLQERRAGLG